MALGCSRRDAFALSMPSLDDRSPMPCPLCDDTGWKPVEDDGVRRVVRCDCWRDSVGRAAARRREHPEALPALHARQLHRLQRIARARGGAGAARRRGVSRRQPGAVPRRAAGRRQDAPGRRRAEAGRCRPTGARGLFYDTRDLLRVIRSTYDPSIRTTELEVLRPVMTADLLVLDDLGAEKTSEWVDETMNLIVNTRYNERRLTIFTSNYQDIPDDTDPNSLLFRIGFRMRSRLHEMCEFLELDGADYRELPANGGVDDLVTLWKMRKKTEPALAARRPPGARAAARAGGARRPRRPQVAGRTGRIMTMASWRIGRIGNLSNLQSPIVAPVRNARPLPPHPLLLRHLQLLQLQSRPVRRGAEDALRRRAGRRDRGGRRGALDSADRAADTIYFGGGTPSLLEPDEIARIIDGLRAGVRRRRRPRGHARGQSRRSVTEARLAAFRRRRRQSTELRRPVVPRRRAAAPVAPAQRRSRARGASREARAAGFDNVSLDLMMWLPGQQRRRVARVGRRGDRARARPPVALPARGVSERAAEGRDGARRAGRRRPTTTRRRCTWRRWSGSRRPGYEQYEISNVARPGRRSRHNLKYWTDGEWLGFGCGAHSTRGGVRWKNIVVDRGVRRSGRRAARSAAVDVRRLTPDERLGDALFTGLRLVDGIDGNAIQTRYGVDVWRRYGADLEPFVEAGCLRRDGARLCLTRQGMLLAHEVMTVFV